MPRDEVITAFCLALLNGSNVPSQAALMTLLIHNTHRARTSCMFPLQRKWETWQAALSSWSDLPTHYAALRWHRVTATPPKHCGNILPSVLSCQKQQNTKSEQPLVDVDMSNKDGFTTATTEQL